MTKRQKTILDMFGEDHYKNNVYIKLEDDEFTEYIYGWWIDEPNISSEKLLTQMPIEDIEKMYDDRKIINA